jgi:thiol-disulfide isomerase/thioredoxin
MFRSVGSTYFSVFLTFALLAASACNRVEEAGTSDETGAHATVPPKDDDVRANAGTDVTTGDQEQTPTTELTVGDAAPTLEIGQWMKGQPVDGFQDGHVYVVEFWATWCGPCRAGMPHISQLQEHFADRVTFIGVSDEEEETVQSFLGRVQNPDTGETWDQVVKYTIALDPSGATNAAYMKAAGQSGIPTAFVVGKDGHVEWIGHPMEIDAPLESIVAGTWDRAAARAEFMEKQAAEAAYMAVAGELRTAQRTGDWTKALETLDRVIEQFPTQDDLKMAKLNALLNAEKFDSADTLAEEMANNNWDDAQLLNQIAWIMATEVPKPHQRLESALRIATRASSLKNNEDASILDTVARVYYEQGNLTEAVAWERKAVEHNSDGIDFINEALKKYEAELNAGDKKTTEGDANKD